MVQIEFDYNQTKIVFQGDLQDKFQDIIGTIENYNYYENYSKLMMNKLEHKCNILENGGTETALNIKHKNIFKELIEKIFKFNTAKSKEDFQK